MKKLAYYFSVLILLSSCNAVKYVSEDELLLTKNNIYIDSIKNSEGKFSEFLLQKPNDKSLGVPLSLYFYNLGNPSGAQEVEQWKERNLKWYQSFENVFSEKQAIAVAKSAIGFNNWFLTNGEPPVVINDKKTKDTEKNLKKYFFTEGYFRAKVSSEKDSLEPKKGSVSYYVDKGEPSVLDSITRKISSKVLDSIYQTVSSKSFLKKGEQYKNANFIKEAERIVKLYRNRGIFHFTENNILFDNDTLSNYKKTKVAIAISDRLEEDNGSFLEKPFQIQKIKKVNVFTDFYYNNRNELYKDTIRLKGINYLFRDEVKFKPKVLSESIFIKPGQLYTDSLRTLTRTHLKSLKNFKTTSIRYSELNDKELEANVFLTPTEKYTLGLETELSRSNIRSFDVAAQLSITNRNTFKGAELFKFSVSGSYFNSQVQSIPGWELGGNISLEVPRLMAPFSLNKLVPKRMFPRTNFHTGVSTQRNIALDRQNISLGVDYEWQPSKVKSVRFELLNVQFIQNLNAGNYFNIYSSEHENLEQVATAFNTDLPSSDDADAVVSFMRTVDGNDQFRSTNPTEFQVNQNILNRYNIITSDFLIPEIALGITYNKQENIQDDNFSFVRVRLANSGNILGFINSEVDTRDQTTFLNLPLAQYFKTDLEYKKFWGLGEKAVLAHRTFLGAILTYNDSNIPFSRSYFAGGSNDIRAWQTYNLGPGVRPPGLEFNIGSLKFLSSFEYRFDLIGSFKSALFTDIGNIWDITNSPLVDNESKFRGINSFSDLAVAGGFGLRYDFKFLVARLDLGFKLREPYLTDSKWFQNTNFSNVIYNIGINYPF